MKKLLIVLFLSVIFLTGCGKNKVVGSWYIINENSINSYYTFNKDMTGSYNFNGISSEFTYEIDGNKMTLNFVNSIVPSSFEFEIKDNTLTISSNGFSQSFAKK